MTSGFTRTVNSLVHNTGDGTFTRVLRGSLVNDNGEGAGCAWEISTTMASLSCMSPTSKIRLPTKTPGSF